MAVRTIRTYAFTAILALVVGLFTMASWRTELQQRDQDWIAGRQAVALRNIASNTTRLTAAVATECLSRQSQAVNSNELLDILIAGARASTVYSPEEKADRIQRYKSARVTLVACPVTP